MGKGARPRSTKSIDFYGVGFDDLEGLLEGIAGVTGNVDRTRERVLPGAFAKTIGDHRANFARVPMGIDHDVGVGVTLDMAEVGRGDLPADVRRDFPDATGGLWCKGQVVMSDTNMGLLRRMRERLDRGDPVTMSFTYSPIVTKAVGGGVTDLAEVAVHEWGPTWSKPAVNPAARVMSVKAGDTGGKASEIPGSAEAHKQAIMDAIRLAGMIPEDGWGYIVGTFPGYVIVSMSGKEMAEQHMRVEYADMSGRVVLGDMSPVDLTMTVTEKAMAEGDLILLVNQYARAFKSGRVLSQRNLDELEAAIASLQRIHAAASSTTDTSSTGDAPDSGEQPAAKADVADLTAPPRDLTALGWELDILSMQAALAAVRG